MTDPKLMAAQLRAWANVVDRIGTTVHALLGNGNNGRLHVETTIADLAAQMRQVAQREDR